MKAPTPKPRPIPDPPGVDPLAIVSQEQARVWLGISNEEQRAARRDKKLAFRQRGNHIQYLRRELDRYLSEQFNAPPSVDLGTVKPRNEVTTEADIQRALQTAARSHARP